MATTTMTGATTPSSSPVPVPFSRLLLGGLLGGSLAAVANLGVYALARSLDVSLVAEFRVGEVRMLSMAAVLFASFLPALLAAGLYAMLQRFTNQATELFTLIMVVGGLITMIWPIMLQGSDVPTQVSLAVMIAVATAIITWSVVWQARADA
jgi:hypothetical protein